MSLTIEPAPDAWRRIAVEARASPLPERARVLREELGLPEGRVVFMSGHQATLWHPGILAKWLSLLSAAASLGVQAAWVVVDQDSEPAASIAYPRLDRGVWAKAMWAWTHDQQADDVPAWGSPAAIPLLLPELDSSSPVYVRDGLARARAALAGAMPAANMAEQVTKAAITLLADAGPAPVLVSATELARTSLFRELIDRMVEDPGRCVDALNAAARANPRARLRELVCDPLNDRYELPLWSISTGRPRRPVYAQSLPLPEADRLAPKALFMTALLRLGACDLFVHGTGGGIYDRATDDWINAWLGEETARTLAPTAVVSATARLPLADQVIPSDADVRDATWRAHAALHNPGAVDDIDGQLTKAQLVTAVARARDRYRGLARRAALAERNAARAAYYELHGFLREYRERRAADIAHMAASAAKKRRLHQSADVLMDRTWPFVLHEPGTLRSLEEYIQRAFAPGHAETPGS